MSYRARTVGFVWRLQVPPGAALGGEREAISVDWTYVETMSLEASEGFVRIPERWKISYPSFAPELRSERFGASEVRGLLGGVHSPCLERLSETVERLVGDAVTSALCEVLGDQTERVCFLMLGAALPKVVGRLASLRLDPKEISVAWICPLPLPMWIAERTNEMLLIPLRHLSGLGSAGWDGWEEESLIRGWRREGKDKSQVIQQLILWEQVDLNVDALRWAEAEFAKNMLPRELILAAGQVENLRQAKYDPNEQEQEYQEPPPGFSVAHAAGHWSRGRGWSIQWK